MRQFTPLVVLVLLMIKNPKVTNLQVEVENVCFWVTRLERRGGSCLIWTPRNYLFLVMSSLLRMFFRLVTRVL